MDKSEFDIQYENILFDVESLLVNLNELVTRCYGLRSLIVNHQKVFSPSECSIEFPNDDDNAH